jgi:hypothetical protein
LLEQAPFKLQAPGFGLPEFAGTARIILREASVDSGLEIPAYVTIEVGGSGGEPEGGLYYGAGFMFSITTEDLLGSTTFTAIADLPGGGGLPDGHAVAVSSLPGSPAPYVLTSGSIVVERGQGTLTGSLVTNTPAGTVTFGGLYRIVCFALQSHTPVAEGNLEPRPGDLVIDEGFVSPFCKQFVPLATGSLGGSRVVGAY